jgi:predicted DNA helicase
MQFDTVLIDEAAQALEPACWIPIEKGKRVIFAGDHLQLPPTVKSNEAAKAGLTISLMEKCIHENNSVMLEVQYRMNEHIMRFSNEQFYHHKLHAHASVAQRTLLQKEDLLASTAFDFIDTAGCGYEEELNPESVSVSNKDEAALLIKHLKMLFDELIENKQNDIDFSIGIISPYKEQVQYITELIAEDEMLKLHHNIRVKTVDGFQGQEKDIIYISLVRSNDRGEIGFLSDTRRMNVALTRAKKKMVVIGDSATISSNEFYEKFVSFTQENGYYKSAWEFAYD